MQDLQYAKTVLDDAAIVQLQYILKSKKSVESIVVFGSVARGDNNCHSDLDLAVVLDDVIDPEDFRSSFYNEMAEHLHYVTWLPKKRSLCLYLKNLMKIDLVLLDDISALKRNYLGSKIPLSRIEASVLLDRTGRVLPYLEGISRQQTEKPEPPDAMIFIDKFLSSFEHCSKFQAKSDAYRFYFHYNCALHPLMQLKYLAEGNEAFIYSPRFVSYHAWKKEEMETFYQLKGTLFLPEANRQKRLLLNEFYKVLEKIRPEMVTRCKGFCEAVFERDYFWNFRDYNLHNSQLDSGKIFRSATPSLYPEIEKVNTLLGESGVATIIDLRAGKETEEKPYEEAVLAGKKYIHAPFDPWNQPKWFEENHHKGSDREIAYRFFLMACQGAFRQVVEGILEADGAVLIHCFAGKDRTGLVVGAIQLLLGCSKKAVVKDYMASGGDADAKLFGMLFGEVDRHGGIEAFFEYQGVDSEQQERLIKKLVTLTKL